jgi:nitrite reductase (NO-forming)
MGRNLPVIDGPDGAIAVGADLSSDRRVVRRDIDRQIALAGVALALAFIVAAAVALAMGRGAWTVLHLVLAGAAGTAIVAVMPFFAAALSMAPPVPPRLRIATVAMAAVGASAVAVAVPEGLRGLALLGAGTYVLALAGLAVALVHASTRGLGRRHRIIVAGYGAGVVFVLLGVTLVIAYLHTFAPVVSRWPTLKPVHAWLNLVGFVGLSLAATYVHLVPTVLGARIASDRLATVAIGGLALGVAGVSVGFVIGSDAVARVFAVAALAGAVAVPAKALMAARQPSRGRWTTDLEWHEFTGASLVASTTWFAVGVAAAASAVILHGATAAAWSLTAIAVPFVVGAVLQALVASATHLVPTLRGATTATRERLGRAARPRIVAWQIGTAGIWAATAFPLTPVALTLSAAVLALAVAAAVVTLGSALRLDPRPERRQPSA